MDSPAAPPEKTLTPENERHRAIQRERPREYWLAVQGPDGPMPIIHTRPNRHERRQRLAGLPRPMREAIKAVNRKGKEVERIVRLSARPVVLSARPVVVEPPASEPAPEPTP
jgi:hypothetical protein